MENFTEEIEIDEVKLRRKIEDALRKTSTLPQKIEIASILNVSIPYKEDINAINIITNL